MSAKSPKYNEIPEEALNNLLDRLADGKKALSALCDELGIGRRTVYDRIERDPDFAQRYKSRRAIGVRAIIDDCLTIADEPATTEIEIKNKRVRIDTRLRLAGKWSPKEFGEKVELTGRNGGPIETVDLSRLSQEQLEQYGRLAAIAEGEDPELVTATPIQ